MHGYAKALGPAGALLLALALVMLAPWHPLAVGSCAPSGEMPESPKEGEMKARYSASGYDITPLTTEELGEIREQLAPEQEQIAFHAGTEPPHCGLYTDTTEPGVYVSVVSGLPLFRSAAKFHSKSGWASFFEPFDPAHIVERSDNSHGVLRAEILDARSGAHLGHVFDDGPPPTGKRYCLNSAALRFIPAGEELPPKSQPVDFQTAYFAGGCFWGIEDRLARLPGVVDAVSGYMGGATADPTYKQVCGGDTGHAETVKVVFDPNRVTYRQLLEAYFAMHDPTTPNRQGPDVGSQYRSAIFAATDKQAEEARTYMRELIESRRFGEREIVTTVEPAPAFYEAEDHHQDYHARHGGHCSS